MALLSIQAAKGVGLGDGFDLAGRPGSEAHDEIFYSDERGYYRETNRSGGLEGGMTTGEPLVARVAMKPIPTLTKPLRSVDIATHEPAQALRERTDSCVVPGGGRRGGGDAGDRAGRRLPRQVRRRPHRRRAAARRRLLRAHRMETPVLVFIGFMGAGKTTGARAAAAALGVRAIDTDRELEQRLGTLDRGLLRLPRRAGVPRDRGGRRRRGARDAAGAGDLARRRRDRLAPACASCSPATPSCMLDVDEATAWRRAGGKRRPLARDRERFAALHAERAPVYESLADAVLLDGGAETIRARGGRAARASRRA